MAKVQLVAGRRVARPTKPAAKPASKTAPAPRVKNTLSGLSLKQIVRATPPYYKNKVKDVVIKALKPATTKGGMPAIRAKTMSLDSKSRHVYDTTVVGKEKDIPVSQQKHVLLSCSCENFTYTWEYALHHWGSAVIKYSNGEPASMTNPGNQPGMCKHLCALVKVVLEDGM